MKIDQNDFAQQISRAEKSVVNVKEERLREIAFGKVLDHLLNASTSVLDQSETRTNPFSRSKLKVENLKVKMTTKLVMMDLSILQEHLLKTKKENIWYSSIQDGVDFGACHEEESKNEKQQNKPLQEKWQRNCECK